MQESLRKNRTRVLFLAIIPLATLLGFLMANANYLLVVAFLSFWGSMCFVMLGITVEQGRLWIFYPILLALWPLTFPLISFYSFEWALLPTLILIVLIFGVWIGNQIVARKRILLRKGPLFYPFLFLIAANALSLLNAYDVRTGLKMVFAWAFIFFLYLAVYNTINKFSWIENFAKALIVACILLSIWGLCLWFSGLIRGGINPFGRYVPLEGNHFAFLLEEGVFLSMFFLMVPNQKFHSRIFYLISSLGLFFALIFTFSRGAWVACILVMLWLTFIKKVGGKHLQRRLIMYSLVIFSIAFVVFYTYPPLRHTFLTIFQGKSASSMRFAQDTQALNTFFEHPFIGVGIDNFVSYYQKRAWVGTANLYSRMLAETGTIGFIAFIMILIKIYRVLSRGAKTAIPGSKQQLIQLGFLSGFLANAIDSFFFGSILPLWWIFFSIGITSAEIVNRRRPD